MRPLLRPGTHPLRRPDGTVQLGLDPSTAVILPDRPGLAAGLLDGSLVSEDDPDVALLEAQGILLDERALMPLLTARPTACGRDRPAGAALARTAGNEAGARAERRSSAHVDLVTFGHRAGVSLAGDAASLLHRSGVPSTTSAHPGSNGSSSRAQGRSPQAVHRASHSAGLRAGLRVGLLLGAGEPCRELADPYLRECLPYLVLRLTEGRAVIGPFVEPGRTACLRCLDAHHADADPAWPLLVHQYAEAASRDRADGCPEPVDPALAALALAWAVRDLVAFLDGTRPTTWSSTVRIGPDPAEVEHREWLRHSECACSWE